jgi:chorismate dehydratase
MNRLKIGAVSYLNTKPLVAGLHEVGECYDLVFDLPSRLADRLASGDLAAALIPIVEAARPDYTIVSNACIACRGPVRSVRLLGRVPPERIQSLALDEGSRTSSILAQVLLAKRYGVRPSLMTELRIDEDWKHCDSDAILIIGDRAMDADDIEFAFNWDLGLEWHQWTGSPFVFAVWAAHHTAPLEELDWMLSTSRDSGLENLEMICARYASEYQLSSDDCLRYLGAHLHFELGSAERAGAELFFKWATELNLISAQPLNFFECSKALGGD